MSALLGALIADATAHATQGQASAEEESTPRPIATYSNPIIPGFAPDPSITRVGEDYYLINSTFEYTPGLPVYHSRDLVNWQIIGHVLERPSQAELATVASSGGTHASTIRHHEGTFYVAITNVVDNEPVSFIVTATDPRGPWSEPHVLTDAEGIDPDLFFDDDGRVWYAANRVVEEPQFPGQAEIWLQELDIERWELVGARHALWSGCCQGVWAEGPHLYKRNGYYYLLISEGGTSYEHAIAIAVSEHVTGPYQNNPRNPVLTHRHLSYDYPISGVGHADLVQLPDDRWYAVALGWRLIDGKHGLLGRETFLLPVIWETEPHVWKTPRYDFPVFSPDTGRVELRFPLPYPERPQLPREAWRDEFDEDALGAEWNGRRWPAEPFHRLAGGALILRLQPGHFGQDVAYSFLGVRQRDFRFEVRTLMDFMPHAPNEASGLAVVMNDRAALTLTASAERNAAGRLVQLQWVEGAKTTALGRLDKLPPGKLHLRVVGNYLRYTFELSTDGATWRRVGDSVDGTRLSPAVLGGFNYTGIYVGPYATSNGVAESEATARFEHFYYAPREDRDGWFARQREGARGAH